MNGKRGPCSTLAAPARTSGLLDEMLDELARRGAETGVELAHGRRLELVRGAVLRVRRPDGSTEVTIEIGPAGPHVRVDAAALEVACRGDVSIECESFDVRAQRRIDLACERGDLRLDAGDDVVVTGERIRLN